MKRFRGGFLMFALLGLLLLGFNQYGYGDSMSHTILIGYKEGIGSYLIDSKGMTLYYFTKDVSGKSACMGGCVGNWPIFYTEEVVVPPGMNPADFGEIMRDDGKGQTTFKGWPLYYFIRDKNPGDTSGEGAGKVWFVIGVPFDSIALGSKEGIGNYVVDSKGMTLYYFKKDSPGKSACMGGCVGNWPIFYTERVVSPTGINPADFGKIMRDDGKEQTTFKGWPLYYFVRDKNRADTSGQGVGDVWFVVDPFTFMP